MSPKRMMRELNSKVSYVLVKMLGEEELMVIKSFLVLLPSGPGLHHHSILTLGGEESYRPAAEKELTTSDFVTHLLGLESET